MVRKGLKNSLIGMNPEFRYRGEEQTRIETFSDAVFALAVTLLVLSSTVPNTLEELKASLMEVVPFGICITLFTVIWYQHYIFFIRYGFKDVKIVAVNTILLFLVLVYVYPLKFLFTALFHLYYNLITGEGFPIKPLFGESLMVIYGIGAAAVFLILAWMYKIALKRKEALQLNELEIFHTKTSYYSNLLMALVPVISAIIAAFGIGGNYSSMVAGLAYWLYMIILPIFHNRRKKSKTNN